MPGLLATVTLCMLVAADGFQLGVAAPRAPLSRVAAPLRLCSAEPEEAPAEAAAAAPAEPAAPAPPPASTGTLDTPQLAIPGPLIALGGAALLGFMPFLKQGIITPPS